MTLSPIFNNQVHHYFLRLWYYSKRKFKGILEIAFLAITSKLKKNITKPYKKRTSGTAIKFLPPKKKHIVRILWRFFDLFVVFTH